MSTDLGFIHRFDPGESGESRALLMLHGTGGDETEIMALGQAIAPGFARLAPRGKSPEGGANRFFRRLAEGVFDIEDLKARAQELADFVVRATESYGIDRSKLTAVGYSNGANIASALLLLRPEVCTGAILFRPVVPFEPDDKVDLRGHRILALSGAMDPLAPPAHLVRLEALFTERGAKFTEAVVPASHGLTRTDLETARAWLDSSP